MDSKHKDTMGRVSWFSSYTYLSKVGPFQFDENLYFAEKFIVKILTPTLLYNIVYYYILGQDTILLEKYTVDVLFQPDIGNIQHY